ncbi:unnamed protein product [Parnassius apollo]|uniref:(apollo) hypothetical protein n=1 Tax=Parnassius apollo TaxID=110799 RepID=A0A8S3W1G8_PARAO|nr:unnamed protein product [Parnassius apollo]
MNSNKVNPKSDIIKMYRVWRLGNESKDGAEEDESEENDEEVQTYKGRADLLRVLEDEREEDEESPTLEQEGPSPNPAEEGPPLLEDSQPEQEPGVHSVQARRQEMRKLLWKKQSMWTSEDDVAFLGSLDYVQTNRLPNHKLPNPKSYMKQTIARGSYEEHMTAYDGTDLSVTMWKDMWLNFYQPMWGRSQSKKQIDIISLKKKKILIDCPLIVKDYNSHMGGVDLLDSYIGRYHITIKNRKWYVRLFHHFLDLAMINSWLAYKELVSQKSSSNEKLCNLGVFRLEVAETLCLMGRNDMKRGRPSSALEKEIQAKKRKAVSQVAPVKKCSTKPSGTLASFL